METNRRGFLKKHCGDAFVVLFGHYKLCDQLLCFSKLLSKLSYTSIIFVPTFLSLLQSALAPLEQVLPQEVQVGCQIGAFLLAGHHPGVPQHPHHIIRAL